MEIEYKTAKFVGKEKELPKEVYEYIYDDKSYEDYNKEKEDKWISQGGGVINFGEDIGTVYFRGDRTIDLDHYENGSVKNSFIKCCYYLEIIRRKMKEGIINKEEITKSNEWRWIQDEVRLHKLWNKEIELRKESFSVSNIEELKVIMERYRKDKTFRKVVSTKVPTPNKIGKTLSISVYTSQGFFISSGGMGGGGTSLLITGDSYKRSFTFPIKNIKDGFAPNQKECFDDIVKYFEEEVFYPIKQ